MAEPQILVVEDEALVAEDIRRTLQNLGYIVPSASSGEEAIKKAGEYKPDLILMDIILKGKMDGIETARQISSRFDIPVIYLTAHSDKTTLDKAKITEPFGYIIKPFKEKELNMAITIAMYKYRTEKKLKESREWLSTTLKSINDAVIATDAEGHVEFMNPLAQSLTGWKIEEVRGKPLQDIINIADEKTKELSVDFATHIGGKGAIKDHQTVLFSREKTKIPVEICSAPIKDDTGNIKGTVIVIRDITERKLTDEALRQSEEKYRTMVENARDVIFTLSREGMIVSLNPSFETVTGWKRSEWLDKPFAHIIHRGDLSYANDLFQRTIQGETPPAKFELHIRLKSDDYILMEFTTAPQVQNGKVERLLCIARDITERKRAEEELRLSEEKYRKLIENNQDGVFIIQDSKIQFANEAFARIVGYAVEEMAGKDFRELVAPEDLEMVSDRYYRRLAGDSFPKEYEFRILHRDGSRFIVNMNVGLITYRGKVASMGTVKDITERKRAEEEILRRSQIQVSLNKLLQISLQNNSLEEILEQIIYHLTSIPWLALESMGGIWLVDKDPDVLVLKAQRGFPASLKTMCACIPFGRCICGRAASSGKIEFVDRIDERHENKYMDIAPHGHYCVPLLASAKVFGVINLFLKEGHRRDEKEEEFLIAISDVLVGIIQRKQAEEALKYSNDFSKTILNSMNDSISIINVNNHEILGVNSVFLREVGLKEEDVIGKKCYEITHQRPDPCKPPKDNCPLLETIQTGKHSLTEHLHYGKMVK